jgi:aminoglycoside phosphotransferase family enzyme/predicted kinase
MSNTASSCSAAETHLSWVFFTPDRAYKLLKPVTMPFIDHADAAQRLESIQREYDLNHEISPDVYLGLADVVEDGQVVDCMLVMRRLPSDRRLSTLIDQPDFEHSLRSVAHAVASLHSRREPILDAPMARRDAMATNWEENFQALSPHVGTVIDAGDFDRAQRLARNYLVGTQPLLDRRIADGFVRDVHGDLTAEDIFCLEDGPRIIDCLAFNDRWRVVDVLSDIGFLVMDIHRLAGSRAAEQLMRWYQEFSNERHPASLAHHYVAYRAHVRAKVACLRVAQGDTASAWLARSYHDLACHYLERARLRVILVGGGPGVGKTTLAQELGAHFGFPVVSTDEVRKDLTLTPHGEHRFASPGEGIYEPSSTAVAYDELRSQAEIILRNGTGVVLDGSWSRDVDRRAARQLAELRGAEIVEVECVLDPAIAKERIGRRLSNPDNPSDATPDLVDYMAARREPWPEAISLDTSKGVDMTTAAAIAEIARTGPMALRTSG